MGFEGWLGSFTFFGSIHVLGMEFLELEINYLLLFALFFLLSLIMYLISYWFFNFAGCFFLLGKCVTISMVLLNWYQT